MKKTNAFTLIELLIVVAIIAILAAIAVPNFLEAQTRAKVARAQTDLRTQAIGLESYAVDNNKYPPDQNCYITGPCTPTGNAERVRSLRHLTTPIAYITSVPPNVFALDSDIVDPLQDFGTYRYYAADWITDTTGNPVLPANASPKFGWALVSAGPNRLNNLGEWAIWFGPGELSTAFPNGAFGGLVGPSSVYDSSNGTISNGDVISLGPGNVQLN